MQSHELLRQVFQSTSPKQISSDLGVSRSLVYKWAEAPAPGEPRDAFNPLDRIDQLIQCTQDARVVQWICQRSGGFFIKNPKTLHAHPDYLIPATNQIVQEFADLLAVIATAASDNHINASEAKTIRKRWEDLKSVTETFVHCCEEGNFGSLRELPTGGRS